MVDVPGDRLVVASNRLPIDLERTADGEWTAEPGSGGLVTALSPVLEQTAGLWVGWPGTVSADPIPAVRRALQRLSEQTSYELAPVWMSERERDAYYYGFSNEVLWPLLHDLQGRYHFDPDYWTAYRDVNRRFAETLAGVLTSDDYLWVHDYHLMRVAAELRDIGVSAPTGYFLHTSFPAPDLYVKLPWRYELLQSLLQYDLIGFQTLRDRQNFLDCVRKFLPGTAIEGTGSVVTGHRNERSVRVGAFPISIDVDEFVDVAGSREVEEHRQRIRRNLPDREILLSVSRLDYTKGIPEQLEAFRAALERHPDLRGSVSLVAVVVPSREGIPEYSDLKSDVEILVGEINGRFAEGGWVPVHYMYRSLSRPELVAYYRSAAAMLVAPLKDGMNLVAKEYCAVQEEGEGALLLSEFAGAAAQLQDGAILVNPYDVVRTADAIHTALTMDAGERRRRMGHLRSEIEAQDIYWWVENFFRAAGADTLAGFPSLREYRPWGRGRMEPRGG